MNSFTSFDIEQRIQDAGKLSESEYLAKYATIEEKFRKWKSKNFLERSTVFQQVASISRAHGDLLSEWLVGEIDVLLDKSKLNDSFA